MADQAERVILEAEDQVTPIVGKANSALGSFENKAESSHGKVIRITDQTRTSVQRLIASLEKQAETYGKSGVEKLISQRDQLLQRYNREPAAVDAITKSYTRMITEQQKIEATAKFEGFGSKVQQFIQAPLQGAQSAIGGVLTAMGPFGAAIAAGAAVLGSIAVAGFEAAKSLGEYGLQIKDVELRTGLTAKEVGQFGFAARVAGQDVSIFERMMRGLTQAVEDESAAGEKARGWLTKFGVDLEEVKNGTASTKDVILQIATGLQQLHAGPDPFAEKKAALDLFKKAGIEMIPVMEDLNKEYAIAQKNGYGPSDAQQKQYEAYNQETKEIEENWAGVLRDLKGIIALPAMKVIEVVLNLRKQVLGGPDEMPLAARAGVAVVGGAFRLTNWLGLTAPDGAGGTHIEPPLPPARSPVFDAQVARDQSAAAGLKTFLGAGVEGAEAKEKQLKTAMDAARSEAQSATPSQASAAKQKLEAAQRAYAQQAQVVKQLKAQEEEKNKLASFTITDKAQTGMENGAPVIGAPPSLYPRTPELANANALGGWTPEFTVNQAEMDKANAPMRAAQTAQLEARFKGEEEQRKQAQQEKLAGIAAEASATERLLELRKGPDGELETAKKVAVVRQEALQQELAVTGDIGKYREESLKNGLDLQVKMAEQQQKEADAAEAQQKQKIDALSNTASGLFHTLFTKPQDFGKQLFGTIKEAALKPITGGLGDMVANAVYGGKKDPVTVSTDQNTAATMQNSAVMAGLTALLAAGMGVAAPSVTGGGSAGIPGVSMPSISVMAKAATPSLPSVWNSGGSSMSGGAEGGAPANSGGSDIYNLPMGRSGSASSPLGDLGDILGGSGEAGAYAGKQTQRSPLGGLLGGIFGGGGGKSSSDSPMGGITGMLGNLKGVKWGGLTRSGAYGAGTGNADPAGLGGSSKGSISGVNGMAGAALQAGGTMLAERGLLGDSRGSSAGIAEGAAGGAMIGFEMGGPLGALIGGVAGFGIGLGEKLAGVMSDPEKAHKFIKQIYGVDIPTNSGTIKQVVSIAKGQYGGDMSVAVRSPSVRQLVMLYSESTGQKMPLSATTPYGATLAESGGKLYQQASYQDGQAHVYASNIPTLGGIAAGTYPTPGGPNTAGGAGGNTYLSLNVGGTDTANFMTGAYVTPQLVADQGMAAQQAGYGRTQGAANMQVPGLTVL